MILTRLGNKQGIASEVYPHFPTHKMRIELFFGAGGSFFNMPRSKYAILNDLDDDVTNLYLVLQERKEEFYNAVKLMPVSASLVKYWKKHRETDPLKKALRFLLLSNFTYLGKGDTLRLGLDNTKQLILSKIEPTFELLSDVKITNYDFRKVLSKISFDKNVLSRDDSFVYLDPVYLDTEHYYKVPEWTKNDTFDCFEIMSNSGIKCAMSEFDHPFILKEAKKRGFNIIQLQERQNIKNRRHELLITNYRAKQYKLF